MILVLVAPFVGMQGWLHIRKAVVRSQVKHRLVEGIWKDELVSLKFSKYEIENKLGWKDEKEFEFDGEMYDVVSVVSVGDSIVYHCWWDNEETHLSKQLNELTALALGTDKSRQERESHFTHFTQMLFFSEPSSWRMAETPVATFTMRNAKGHSAWNISPPSPPPEA